jgi:pimeloyl-ACP methyl ester carboxylesterase
MNCSKWGLAFFASLILTACAGIGDGNTNHRGIIIGAPTIVAKLPVAQLDELTLNSLWSLAGKAICDVTVVQINYQTSGAHLSEMTNASAAVFVPSGVNCPGPFPLIAYGRGTEVAKAHTVANPQDPQAIGLMTFFAAQGYAVVATDFLGYALSRYPYHPYTHADSEASSVIDSIRATRHGAALLGLSLNGKVMVTGYSQGGHASMATQREIEREDSGEFNLVAAAHLAGPYNISGALIDGVKNPILGVQAIGPFEITSLQKVYGNLYDKATDVFNLPYASYIEALIPTLDTQGLPAMLPSGTPEEARDKIFKSAYLADLRSNLANRTRVAAKKQDLLGWDPKAPTTLCGASADPTVKFLINAKTAYDDFASRGGTTATLVDVNPAIVRSYGTIRDSDPEKYNSLYHGTYEIPFCYQVARELFDQYR